MSGEQAFSFSWGNLEMMRARARAGVKVEVRAQTSRMALKIRYKLFLEYLGTLVAARRAISTGGFYLWEFIGLFEKFVTQLEMWREVRGSNGESNGGRNKESNGGMLPAETFAASDWGNFSADILLKTFFQTGWLTHWVRRNYNYKKKVVCTKLGHVQLQRYSVWLDRMS